MTKIYGCSDDLVEIEGSRYRLGEIDCYGSHVRFSFDDGTVIRIGYDGEWKIRIAKAGTATHVLTSCEERKETDPDAYSDIFETDAEIVGHRKVRPGKLR